MLEELKDPETSTDDKLAIKKSLSIVLDDGGIWGETVNAQTLSASDLKQKVIDLQKSI